MQYAEETAVVSQIDGDFAFIETQSNGSCGNCSSKSGCSNILSIFALKPMNKLRINNTLSLKEGDSVVVAISSDKILMATFLMYLLPLIMLFVFSLIAKLFFGESASILAGLFGLFSGLLWVKNYTQHSDVATRFQPKLIRKIIKVEVA